LLSTYLTALLIELLDEVENAVVKNKFKTATQITFDSFLDLADR
jgi:hypothetical protein